MKPTKSNSTLKRLRLTKEKIKLLEPKKLDDVVGGGGKVCPPCNGSWIH